MFGRCLRVPIRVNVRGFQRVSSLIKGGGLVFEVSRSMECAREAVSDLEDGRERHLSHVSRVHGGF